MVRPSLALVLSALLVACGGGLAPPIEDCEWRGDAERARPARAELGPVNPDFARMRAFRSYVQVTEVGPYVHHFRAWYSCIEPTVLDFTAEREGTRVVVERKGGYWGGLGVRMRDPDPVPSSVADMESAIRRAIHANVPAAGDVVIAYLGAYRAVSFHEVMPTSPPGDPLTRMTHTASFVVAANEDLTRIEHVHEARGGVTRLCWEDTSYVPCHGPARWVRVPASLERGEPLLPRFNLGVDEPGLAPLREALLEAARASLSDEPSPPFDDLLEPEESLLPASIAQDVTASVQIYARVREGEQPSRTLTVTFPANDVVFEGVERRSEPVEIDGRRYWLTLRVRPDAVPASDAAMAMDVAFTVEARIEDDAGHSVEATRPARAEVILEGGRVALAGIGIEETSGIIHLPMPGFGRFQNVDAYLDTSMPTAVWPAPAR
jgi:hypothetical protein